jgi:NADPH:quinone reductase-like Zn-dependent oxidoreductase
MQAIVQRRYGMAPEGVLRLEPVARPAIRHGEVLVRVRAVTPAIDRSYPLSQAAAALRHLIQGQARGKIVVTV